MITREEYLEMMTNRNMLCPVCRAKLVEGKPCAYETLGEHVCDPDGDRPVRTTFVCPREGCKVHEDEVFWSYDGEGPYTKNWDAKYDWQDGNPNPFNSHHRKIYFAVEYDDEDRWFTWGKLRILREVRYGSNDFGEKVDQRVRYRIVWDNVYWTPGFKMFIFLLRCFYGGHPMRKDQVKEARDIIERATPRGYYKPEWWRKAAKLWIRVFHLHIYRKAMEGGYREVR